MSTAYGPQQPQHTGAEPPSGPSPAPPHAGEASRLPCAGVYLDPGHRDRFLAQLHLHEQRVVAPSLGFDAARVLAHALPDGPARSAREPAPAPTGSTFQETHAVRYLRSVQGRIGRGVRPALTDLAHFCPPDVACRQG